MSPRDRILARRAKFIAAALAASGAASLAGCGQVEEEPRVDAAVESGTDTGPQPCLTTDAEVCLSAPLDTGVDTGPTPCLEPPLDSGIDDGDADAEPAPCLKMAPDSSFD